MVELRKNGFVVTCTAEEAVVVIHGSPQSADANVSPLLTTGQVVGHVYTKEEIAHMARVWKQRMPRWTRELRRLCKYPYGAPPARITGYAGRGVKGAGPFPMVLTKHLQRLGLRSGDDLINKGGTKWKRTWAPAPLAYKLLEELEASQ